CNSGVKATAPSGNCTCQYYSRKGRTLCAGMNRSIFPNLRLYSHSKLINCKAPPRAIVQARNNRDKSPCIVVGARFYSSFLLLRLREAPLGLSSTRYSRNVYAVGRPGVRALGRAGHAIRIVRRWTRVRGRLLGSRLARPVGLSGRDTRRAGRFFPMHEGIHGKSPVKKSALNGTGGLTSVSMLMAAGACAA